VVFPTSEERYKKCGSLLFFDWGAFFVIILSSGGTPGYLVRTAAFFGRVCNYVKSEEALTFVEREKCRPLQFSEGRAVRSGEDVRTWTE
jgi:hypothetical protein